MADEALTAGAVARRLGVAVTTLRTWHQRYGLGPSHHVPGQHRRYTAEDMARLQVMRRLTAQGVTPAEAAAWARRVPVSVDASAPASPAPVDVSAPGSPAPLDASTSVPAVPVDVPGADTPAPFNVSRADFDVSGAGSPAPGSHPAPPAGGSLAPGRSAEDAPRDRAATPTFTRAGDRRSPPLSNLDAVWPELDGHLFTARDGGGHAIPTGRAGPAARGLARAAMRLDGPAVRDIVEMTVTDRGVIGAWEEVIMPVLIGVGERYAATKRYIEVEHLLSRGISEVLGSVTRPPSSQSPRVLLAAADEEQHTLPLEALAAALAQAGVASRLLGARVPPRALAEAVARTGPAAVVLWSQLPGTGDPRQWSLLLSAPHPPVLTAAAGPGWLIEQLPEGVTFIAGLTEAVHLVAAAVFPR